MTDTDTNTDPCSGCPSLIERKGLRPYCQRATAPEQIGCTRWPPRGRARQAPTDTRARTNRSRRHG